MAFRGVDPSGLIQANQQLLQVRLAERQREEQERQRKREAKARARAAKQAAKESEFRTIGSIVGAVGGAVALGPAGIATGAQIGSTLGGSAAGAQITPQELIGTAGAAAQGVSAFQQQQRNAQLAQITLGERRDAVTQLQEARLAQIGQEDPNRAKKIQELQQQFQPAFTRLDELSQTDQVDPQVFDLELRKFDRRFGVNPNAVGNERLKGLFSQVQQLDRNEPDTYIEGLNTAINTASLVNSTNTPTVLRALENQRDNYIQQLDKQQARKLQTDANEFLRTKNALSKQHPNLSEPDLILATDAFLEDRRIQGIQNQEQVRTRNNLRQLEQQLQTKFDFKALEQGFEQQRDQLQALEEDRRRALASTSEFAGAARELFGDREGFVPSPQFMSNDEVLDTQRHLALKTAALKKPDAERQLRGEYVKQSKEFFSIDDAFRQIQAFSNQPSAAGDIGIVFSYMKMLDPTSTVREGEFATAANAAGIPDRIKAQWNRLVDGERLAQAQRTDFVSQSENLYKQRLLSHKQVADRFSALAERNNLDPQNVILDHDVFQQNNLSAPSDKTKSAFSSEQLRGMTPQQLKTVDPEKLELEQLMLLDQLLGN